MTETRHRMKPLLASLLLALLAAPAAAQPAPAETQAAVHAAAPATPPDLPPTAQAVAWIEQDPAVAQARSALAAATHAGAAIAASPHEWTARVQEQRRDYKASGERSREWIAQLERPVRINGKAGMDRTLGELEVQVARARLGEARHETARALADLWLDLVLARGRQALFDEQLSFAQASAQAVETRRRAGDASLLETHLARADLGEAQRQASLAATQLARAQARLEGRFPGATPAAGPLSEPVPPQQPLAWWRERILSEADPIRAAQAQLQRARVLADRASADRVPDPTLGVFTASEAQRTERLVGVSLAIPLGGEYRRARASQALREAEAAQAEVDRLRREIGTEVVETYTEAQAGVARWRAAEGAAEASRASVRLTQRAYALGEADLQALLLARRQSLDAARAALESRVEALRWRHRLLVDAHLVWDLEQD